MKGKNNRILIWSTTISSLLVGKNNIGGIAVQLYFWAQTFSRNGWDVHTLTRQQTSSNDSIIFEKWRNWGKMEIFHEWLGMFWLLFILRPKLVISRGADRVAYPLAVLSKLFGSKYIFFGASDVNFEPGKELMAGGKHNRMLWQKAVTKIKYFVVQNQHQQETLKMNYHKDSLVLFNLWGNIQKITTDVPHTDVVWVANLRKLKRPEWILFAAKSLPNVDFTMIGGPTNDKEYYDDIQNQALKMHNIHFLGQKQFAEVNAIVANARLLCCTSTFEGFPNTFLQAWANDLPVISTVDPSKVISTNAIGIVVETREEFIEAVSCLLSDSNAYVSKKKNVRQYFIQNHSADIGYQKLLKWIEQSIL